jgi:hypothetical protein
MNKNFNKICELKFAQTLRWVWVSGTYYLKSNFRQGLFLTFRYLFILSTKILALTIAPKWYGMSVMPQICWFQWNKPTQPKMQNNWVLGTIHKSLNKPEWIFKNKYSFFFSQRKCIFPEEVKLQYYTGDNYTFTGCMKECRMKKCLKFCKCLPPFYHPAGNLPYCEIQDIECLSKYLTNITDIRGCAHCELSCHNTVYDIEKFSKT